MAKRSLFEHPDNRSLTERSEGKRDGGGRWAGDYPQIFPPRNEIVLINDNWLNSLKKSNNKKGRIGKALHVPK